MAKKKSQIPKSSPPPPKGGFLNKKLREYRKQLRRFGGRKA